MTLEKQPVAEVLAEMAVISGMAINGISFKRCYKCNFSKLLSEFSTSRRERDGRQQVCKICNASYRESITDRRLAYGKTYHHADRDRHNARSLQRYYDNKEKRFFYTRMRSLWCKHGSRLPITHVDLARLWHRQKGRCALSGLRLTRDNSNLDHIIPLKPKDGRAPGSFDVGNLRWTHKDANHAKNNLTDAEFFSLCKAVVEHNKL